MFCLGIGIDIAAATEDTCFYAARGNCGDENGDDTAILRRIWGCLFYVASGNFHLKCLAMTIMNDAFMTVFMSDGK